MALPNPSMSFSPFAILTAEEMNNLIENIESLADGTGFDAGAISTNALDDDSVTDPKIDWSTLPQGSGYIKFGSLLICYAVANATESGNSVSFPSAFASTPVVTIGPRADDTGMFYVVVRAVNTTSVTLKVSSGAGTRPVMYMAIGQAA